MSISSRNCAATLPPTPNPPITQLTWLYILCNCYATDSLSLSHSEFTNNPTCVLIYRNIYCNLTFYCVLYVYVYRKKHILNQNFIQYFIYIYYICMPYMHNAYHMPYSCNYCKIPKHTHTHTQQKHSHNYWYYIPTSFCWFSTPIYTTLCDLNLSVSI